MEGWSLRFYHAINAGCIPVFLADKVELPFSQLIDYTAFSVKVLEKDAAKLAKILASIRDDQIVEKQAALEEWSSAFRWTYFTEGEGGTVWSDRSALDMLMRILRLKVRYMRNSPYHFWLDEEYS